MKLFVSSVQSEFARERKALARYIREDPVLGEFFEVFLFEEQPARSRSPQDVYLSEVEACDVYLGLFGARYGSRDAEGVSPTEREYDCARRLGKVCFGFVKNGVKREKDEERFVRGKIDRELSRNPFRDLTGLKTAVYKTLVNYLKEDDLISNKPFDESFSRKVKLSDLSPEKIREYVRLVRTAGKVSFPADISDADVLVRIGAMEPESGRITNAAIPLFAAHPEMVKPAWEVRCLHFYGTEVEKPIPSLHTYTGTVFELVDQALEFVMSRVDFMIGSRGGPTAAAPTKAEFPRDAVQEAIVNAVCHRDYRSNGCVQVMLFRNRLEIINPGSLPKGWTVEKLYGSHDSKPRNELIARAMSWTSYVEKSGSGTGDILNKCRAWGLATPKYLPDNVDFKTIIWRNGYAPNRVDLQAQKGASRVASQVASQVASRGDSQGTSRNLHAVLSVMSSTGKDMSCSEVSQHFGYDRASSYIRRILAVLLDDGLVETTSERRQGARQQAYRLTAKGRGVAKGITTRTTTRSTTLTDSHGPVNGPVNGPVKRPVNGPVFSSIEELVRKTVVSHPGLSRPALVQLVGKSRTTVSRGIVALIAAGCIEHRGSAKTGGYYPVAKGGER